ncbi:MAG: YdcF family protein [Erysipelotrichales bacterium]|nr:YdcF family protein [Erysipelotrichales bacterium]
MKLSSIKYSNLFFKYKKDYLEKIVFCDYKSKKINTDYGIVFGGVSMLPFRVEETLKLYNEGLINKIIVTGGIGYLNFDKLNTEAMKMKKYFIKHNVKEDDIIVESNSKTSYQNIKNVLNMLNKENIIENKTFSLITSDFHLKRCMLMMSKLTGARTYGICVKDNKTDIDNWNKTLYAKFMIIREAILLIHYSRKGIISDIDIDFANHNV